jgi:hypothetical protein
VCVVVVVVALFTYLLLLLLHRSASIVDRHWGAPVADDIGTVNAISAVALICRWFDGIGRATPIHRWIGGWMQRHAAAHASITNHYITTTTPHHHHIDDRRRLASLSLTFWSAASSSLRTLSILSLDRSAGSPLHHKSCRSTPCVSVCVRGCGVCVSNQEANVHACFLQRARLRVSGRSIGPNSNGACARCAQMPCILFDLVPADHGGPGHGFVGVCLKAQQKLPCMVQWEPLMVATAYGCHPEWLPGFWLPNI